MHPTTHPTTIHPLHVYKDHESFVNSIAFDSEGIKMYTGDGIGCLKVWSCRLEGANEDTLRGDKYQCIKTISVEQVKCFIEIVWKHKRS